ncbi:MAG: hypothetical protein EPO32_14500 [Anaerolineae bacterium]|nr:MAG: hypothetical protein EPO32_14500 [Anaerolineae bacterium]
MLAPVTHITALARIRRKRMLPVPGTVLVRAGQTVAATDVVAEAVLAPQHIVIDVVRGLGVPAERAMQFIEREVGEDITRGSIVAKRGMGRELPSKVDGRIVAISNGQILVEVQSKPFQLMAGMPGTVSEVTAEYGVTIEGVGAWVQGLWGNGHISSGTLVVMMEGPDDVFSKDKLDPSQRGTVMLGGYCGDRKALEGAQELQLRGLILSSLATPLIPIARRMAFPVLVLEGFGKLPMNAAAYKLLSTNAGREIAVDAEPFDRFSGERPEAIIGLPAGGQPPVPLDLDTFKIGQRVRVGKAPRLAAIGSLRRLPEGLSRFNSGLRAYGAEVEFENGETSLVPLANIEVIG